MAPPTADEPSDGQTVTGTGIPGARIEVVDALDNVLGTATVRRNGTFAVELEPDAGTGEELLVYQIKNGQRSQPVAVDVDTSMQVEIVVTIDPRTITEGHPRAVKITGANFTEGMKVRGTVKDTAGTDTVVDLGIQLGDEKGQVEFTLDASELEPGKHRVSLIAPDDGDYGGYAVLAVRPADDEPTPKPTSSEKPSPKPTGGRKPTTEPTDHQNSHDDGDDEELPATGAGGALGLVGLGGVALAGTGTMIMRAARRRTRGGHRRR